jgi:transcriptional regulator with XRE-family HTH domain
VLCGTLPCMNWSPHHWKEARRLHAWELLQCGWSQRQIAEAMGVSEAGVSQWMKRAREPGPAAQRLHVERLPAYAPKLNPGEGLWGHLQGVERRHLCCFDLPHLRRELRDAVKRVRRKPRVIAGFFQGAKL